MKSNGYYSMDSINKEEEEAGRPLAIEELVKVAKENKLPVKRYCRQT
jgi:hypothetical protein